MSYSLSFDCSVKVKSVGEAKKLAHHTGRDVDERAGQPHRHANEMIDPARTMQNATLVYDAARGKRVQAKSLEQVGSALEHRLSEVTGRKVKNPVIMRGIILQLDPEWYSGRNKKERAKAANDMLRWAETTFGAENLIYVSRHVDESNEHLHIGMCPVTEDGRLSQKDWFGSPAKLRQLHDSFREFMADAGYDVDMQRRKPGKYAERKSEADYKAFRELQKREAALDRRERALELAEGNCKEQTAKAVEGLKMASKALAARGRDTRDIDAALSGLVAGTDNQGLSL